MKSDSRGRVKLKSVNTAMYFYFCLLSVLLVVLVDVVFYIIVSATLENQARERVEAVGAEVVLQTEYRGADPKLSSVFSRYREEGIFVLLLDKDGNVLLPENIEVSADFSDRLLSETQSLEVGSDMVYRSGGFVNFASLVQGGGQDIYVIVSYSLTIVKNTVGTMQLYLLLISAVVLLLAFFISYSLSQKLTRGLKDMSDTAVRFAKGDFDVTFANADYKELASLSDTLNFVRDEVKKSRDFQREILANVTHDLKTPLTMIKAYASMVKEISGDNPEKRNMHLQVIIDESDRLTGLVNDVLSVSKVSSNLDSTELSVFGLTEFLYSIINKFGYLQESGYNIMVDIDDGVYTRADKEKIGQVIYNLLGNAVSYTGEDKTVYVSLKRSMDGQRARFSVRDTGAGISKEDLPNIWERYYSAGGHNRPIKGTGLGLNIVKVILKNHSFDFGVESGEGKGSLFWVDFPSVPKEE